MPDRARRSEKKQGKSGAKRYTIVGGRGHMFLVLGGGIRGIKSAKVGGIFIQTFEGSGNKKNALLAI